VALGCAICTSSSQSCSGAAWPAQQLNLTQPAVSKAIGDLEYRFGVELLVRRPQGVEPTMYGRPLLKRAKWRSMNSSKP
jgi:hypothetical protein